ncbi:MAG: phenylacetate--CoA ligase family protein [Candidatus Niyogibacteria bacterium]|nr:MAG: phenylacetate--CoA ligase family protein [Candidatus Niyogibacteria bacterium]
MAKKNPEGFKEALKLFKESARIVPAYGSFLRKHGVNPVKVNSYADFVKVPATDKPHYLRAFDFFDLFPKSKVPPMISASSGSSGKPFYWPRGEEQEKVGGRQHERIFRDIFGVKKEDRTLVVVCFSMGTWIAGSFTMTSVRWLEKQGYNISVITPSIEKEDAVNILRDLAPIFDRIILAGYPPFLRDVIEEARAQKVNIKNLRLNLLFAGENFSEKYRAIIHQISGIKNGFNGFSGSVSIYGTADAGAIGHETPATILIRRTAFENKSFAKTLGLDSFIPTIVQYDPRHVFFEMAEGELLFTARAGIPLMRYNIHDTGRIIGHEDMRVILKKANILDRARALGFEKWKSPFIFLGARSDVATTFYALNIYPENIKVGLERKNVYKFVTGKFIAYTRLFRNGRDQKLFIEVELARGVKPAPKLLAKIRQSVFEGLTSKNMEYRKLNRSIGAKALPNIILAQFGDPRFVVRKSKHKWSKR